MVELFQGRNAMFLLPTHKAVANIFDKAKEQGIDIDEERVKVFANYFSEYEEKYRKPNKGTGKV